MDIRWLYLQHSPLRGPKSRKRYRTFFFGPQNQLKRDCIFCLQKGGRFAPVVVVPNCCPIQEGGRFAPVHVVPNCFQKGGRFAAIVTIPFPTLKKAAASRP